MSIPPKYLIVSLELVIVIIRQRLSRSLGKIPLELVASILINCEGSRLEGGRFNEYELIVPAQLPGQPQEGLLEVVIALGGNIIILQILLAVEGDLLGFDFAVFDLDLVSGQDDGDVLADAREVAVPVGDVLVGDAGGDVEHDDGALALDVVSVAEASEFFLPGGIPYVEFDGSAIGVECERVDFDSERGDVLLFEFSGEMALDKGCFSHSSVADEDEFEFWYFLGLMLGAGAGVNTKRETNKGEKRDSLEVSGGWNGRWKMYNCTMTSHALGPKESKGKTRRDGITQQTRCHSDPANIDGGRKMDIFPTPPKMNEIWTGFHLFMVPIKDQYFLAEDRHSSTVSHSRLHSTPLQSYAQS